jgi:hypothetical protein
LKKDLLLHIGESSAYSSKGHFKAADLRRITTYLFLVLNMILSIVCLTNLIDSKLIQICSIISLSASVLLLISETHGGLGICKDHMKFGNEYLELHNLALKYYLSDNIPEYQIDDLYNSLNKLNKIERPNINIGAKVWAKIAIEKWKEMNIWWK